MKLVIRRHYVWKSFSNRNAKRDMFYNIAVFDEDVLVRHIGSMPPEGIEPLIPSVKGEWFEEFLEIENWPEGFL